MNFKYTQYFPLAIVVLLTLFFFFFKEDRKLLKWIHQHWFYEASIYFRLRQLFYFTSFLLFFIALLDLRGPAKIVRGEIPEQKTIIIVDASASMLAEDVKPNRFEKAILLARHFIRNSYASHISIMVFSDIKRKIVPFTDDVNLLDARIESLKELDISKGSSNIALAIMEAIQDFKQESSDENDPLGNILVLTDSENTGADIKIDIPNKINLAIVGIGTRKGSSIPLRDKQGRLQGHKRYQGTDVITKLDEDYIKKIGANAKSFKYWVVQSYNLPTDEIISFFKTNFKKSLKQGNLRVEPVLSFYLMLAAVIFYMLSVLVGRMPSFKIPANLLAIILFLSVASPFFNERCYGDELSRDDVNRYLSKLEKGKIRKKEQVALAEYYSETKNYEKAKVLYKEALEKVGESDPSIAFNYGTVLLALGELNKGLEIYRNLVDEGFKDKELLAQNIIFALKKKEEDRKQKKKDEKKKKEEKKEDNNKENNKKDEEKNKGAGAENNKKQGSGGDKKQEDQNGKNDQEKSKSKDKSGNEKESEKREQQKKNDDTEKNNKDQPLKEMNIDQQLQQKENEDKRRRSQMQLNGIVKQLLNEDKELQRQYMNPRINRNANLRDNKNQGKEHKDW